MKRILKAQNTAGYNNGQATVSTAGTSVKGISSKQSFQEGSLASSRANITINRFDTVPLVRNFENNYWFGRSNDGGS